jgi:tetratricopeptide (TPR) repeat protein
MAPHAPRTVGRFPGGPFPLDSSTRSAWLLLASFLVLTALVYARTLRGEFQWDDATVVVENASIRNLPIVLAGFVPALFQSGRPVVELTAALNYAMGGLDPLGYHLVNLGIHLWVVVLVFVFTRTVLRLAGSARPLAVSVVVAGLFALHPLQTQAVSYVAQRAESLASGFYLATLLLLIAAERRGATPRGAFAYGAALTTFLLGLGSKPIVVTLPAAYLLLALVVPRGTARGALASWPRQLALILPIAALDALVSARTVASVQGTIDAGFNVAGLPPATYFLTQWKVIVTYLRLLLVPVGQFVDWTVPAATGPGELAVLLSGALLAGIIGVAGWLFLSGRSGDDLRGGARVTAAFGILWFFLLLAPTSSVVPIADLLMEHRIYLASWGIFVAIVVSAERLLERARVRPIAAATAVGVVLFCLGLLTFRRNAVWETRIGLWSNEVACAPDNWRAHLGLGLAYVDKGMTDSALRELRAAYEGGGASTPFNEAFILDNVASVLVSAGRPGEALGPVRRIVELRPQDTNALFNLANILKDQGTPAADRSGGPAEACAIWGRLAADGTAEPSIRGLSARAFADANCPR